MCRGDCAEFDAAMGGEMDANNYHNHDNVNHLDHDHYPVLLSYTNNDQ
jgi:hypothetical protein